MSENKEKRISDRFIAWLNEISQGDGRFLKIAKQGLICGDTVTRWKNGKQTPTLESIENAVDRFVEDLYKESGEPIQEKRQDIWCRLAGIEGCVCGGGYLVAYELSESNQERSEIIDGALRVLGFERTIESIGQDKNKSLPSGVLFTFMHTNQSANQVADIVQASVKKTAKTNGYRSLKLKRIMVTLINLNNAVLREIP